MTQKNLLKIAMLFVFAMITNFSFGQLVTTIDFETENDGYTPSATEGSTFTDVFNRINDDIGGNDTFKFGVEDLSLSNPSIQLDQINVAGSESFTFSIDMLAHHYQDWDASDELLITYSLDGGSYVNLMWVQAINTDGSNAPAALDLAFDGDGDCGAATTLPALSTGTADGCTVSADTFATFVTSSISLSSNSTLDIKLQFNNLTSSDEGIYLDNIVITETAGAITPTVRFDTAASSVNETDIDVVTTGIPVSFINYDSADVEITATVNALSTAEAGDYTIDLTALTFDANETLNIPLTIHADADTDDETIIIDFTVTDGTATLGTSQHTVTIVDDEAPAVEDFTNSNATSSYGDNNFVGNNGITWTYVASRDENGDGNSAGIDGNALMLRRVADDSKVTSSTISGGIGNFSVKLYKGFTGGGARQVELFINGVSKGTSTIFDDNDEHIFTVNNINIEGDIVIELRNTKSVQIIVDDISWTGFVPVTVTWEGDTDSDWGTLANWDTNELPTNINNVVIPDVATAPIISSTTGALAYNLSITEPDGLTINSGGSLIVNGTSTGNVTYNRTINAVAGDLKGWYLMASPVAGQDYNDAYVTANDIAIKGTNRGISTYTTGSNNWLYHQGAASATFNSGTGYSVKRASTGTVSFTGTINTDNLGVDAVLTLGGDRYNLLGNPYTSYISSATFLNDEAAISETQTMWVYNQTSGTDGSYEVKTIGDAFVVAPGQGFFVQANAAGGTFNFDEANQSHNADTFQKEAKTEIKLSITDGTINQYAKVYYLNNATTGFDVGYDGEVFGGKTENFSVYSELISDNQGKKYQVQSLPKSNLESMIIPVGLKAAAGKEITFSVEAKNLQNGINVYLEDRLLNTYTRLDEVNSSYKVTLTEVANGTGRFYLHTASKSLKTDSEILNSVSIYNTTNNKLKITGLQNENALVTIYNILGKQVLQESFFATNNKEITLPNLASGVYIVQLQNKAGKLSKKIVLE